MANPEHLAILKKGVRAWNKWRKENPETLPDFTEADLRGADLTGANLSEADLIRVNLSGVNLTGASLSGADLTGALIVWSAFANNDLSSVKGLESVRHLGPSSIGIDTIYRSKGSIPEAFLRGAGVPDDFITYMRSLVGKPIEFYSCFISYSTKDQEFAERLSVAGKNTTTTRRRLTACCATSRPKPRRRKRSLLPSVNCTSRWFWSFRGERSTHDNTRKEFAPPDLAARVYHPVALPR